MVSETLSRSWHGAIEYVLFWIHGVSIEMIRQKKKKICSTPEVYINNHCLPGLSVGGGVDVRSCSYAPLLGEPVRPTICELL